MAREIAWKERDANVLIGGRHTRIDGVEKASGRAKYTADINTEGTLHAALLTAEIPAGTIKSLDVSGAKKSPGVRAVYLFPGKDGKPRTVIRWDGTPIVAVAADRPEQAQAAIKNIKIEIEPAEHWVDEEDLDGAKKAAKRTKPMGDNKKGNVAQGLQDAKVVHKGYYGIATISHMCLEPHGSHCEWTGDDKLNVHLSTQNVSNTGGQFAAKLGIGASDVSLTCNYIGGGFGSKFAADEWGIACAKLAKDAGKPVRLMLDRATELKIGGTRPSGFIRITIGADADGKITAWDSEHWGTSGMGGSPARLSGIPYVFDFDNRNRKATGIITNCGPTRAWRAPPHPQLCAMSHVAIDDVAAKLGKNSYDVFLANLDKTPHPEIYAGEMKIGAKLIDWKAKWHPHGKGGGNGSVKRGLGMALHMWGGRAHRAKCIVKVHPDGTVESSAGSQDLGTGTKTVIAITLAETFGLPISAIRVNIGSNQYVASGPSGGSTTVGGVTGPNRRAALLALSRNYEKDDVKRREMPEGIFDLVAKKYKVDANLLAAVGGYIVKTKDGKAPKASTSSASPGSALAAAEKAAGSKPSELWLKAQKNLAKMFPAGNPALNAPTVDPKSIVCTWKQGCRLLGANALEIQGEGPKKDGLTDSGVGGVQMADVSVDTDTGLIRVNQIVAVQDCGLIIDLMTAESQVYGGVIMGIAYALSEERIMDNATGRYINANLRDYKLPRIGDIGDITVEMYQPDSEYDRGVIGLGEPPVIATGAAISNAVANATGVRVPVLPLTPKRVLDALKGGKA